LKYYSGMVVGTRHTPRPEEPGDMDESRRVVAEYGRVVEENTRFVRENMRLVEENRRVANESATLSTTVQLLTHRVSALDTFKDTATKRIADLNDEKEKVINAQQRLATQTERVDKLNDVTKEHLQNFKDRVDDIAATKRMANESRDSAREAVKISIEFEKAAKTKIEAMEAVEAHLREAMSTELEQKLATVDAQVSAIVGHRLKDMDAFQHQLEHGVTNQLTEFSNGIKIIAKKANTSASRANASYAAVAKSALVKSVKLGDVRKQQTTTKLTSPVQQKQLATKRSILGPQARLRSLTAKGFSTKSMEQ